MARNSKSQQYNGKPKGPSSDTGARKTKTMDELLCVAAMEVETVNETEEDDLRDIQRSQQTYRLFSEWLTAVHSNDRSRGPGKQGKSIELANRKVREIEPIPILQFNENEVDESPDNGLNDNVVSSKIKIDVEDIQSEIDFWSSSVVCYVIGADPRVHVMEGFVRRIWKNKGVDRVAMIKKGLYIVRFLAMDRRDEVLAPSMLLFDSKPLIMKAWEQDKDFFKEEVDVVPAWIQLRVDFKYWSEKCLEKFATQIGRLVKVDQATVKREKLQYARIMVEVKLTQNFPDQISFINEKGIKMVVEVKYEWKPILCSNCKKIGHGTEECRWRQDKRVLKQKIPVKIPAVVQEPMKEKVAEATEFQVVRSNNIRVDKPIEATVDN